MSNAERLIEAIGTVFTDGETQVDQALIERMIAGLDPITSDDVTTVMAGPDDSFMGVWEGREGLREAWADWLESWAQVRFEVEGLEQIGDNVLTLGRQVGTTRVGGVELEQPSAAVWKFRDGMIVRVEFHLDRDKAHASAAEPA